MTAPEPLSVCMVSDDFLPGATGVGTHVQTISEHLAAQGHRISVITTRRRGEPEREQWRGVSVYRVPTVKVAGFYQALPSRRLLARILEEEKPDLVHQHYLGLMMLQMMKVARQRGLRQVYTYHMTEDVLVQPWFMKPFKPLIARQIVRSVNRMDHVISVSQGVAATLPIKGIDRPITTISNPVDFPDPANVCPAPRDDDFIVMYAGRLEPEKNLQLLLKAFSALLTELPAAVLWLAGRGSQRTDLERLAAQLGIGSRLRFLGFLGPAELAQHYRGCDVFVLPSLVETQGLVALEAMWFSKPILVSETVASAAELVVEGFNGWHVSSTDPRSLMRRLAELQADPGQRQQMGQASRQRALAASAPIVSAQLGQLYGRLRNGQGAP